MSKKSRRSSLPPFVPATKAVLDQLAWKACSFGARLLYIALKRFLNEKIDNNGRIHISYRDACKALGTKSFQSVARWFAELEFYGFIVKTAEGRLGADGAGISPHYRLTERPYNGQAATRDYERWDGVSFVDPQTEKRRSKIQNPVPVVGTPRSRGGYIRRAKKGVKKGGGCSRDGYIDSTPGCSRDGYITSLPLPEPKADAAKNEWPPMGDGISIIWPRAVSNNPDDRCEPEPGQTFGTVAIREVQAIAPGSLSPRSKSESKSRSAVETSAVELLAAHERLPVDLRLYALGI